MSDEITISGDADTPHADNSARGYRFVNVLVGAILFVGLALTPSMPEIDVRSGSAAAVGEYALQDAAGGDTSDFSCADVTEIPQIECEALVAFYNSTGGHCRSGCGDPD
jgi:hypothetical protein